MVNQAVKDRLFWSVCVDLYHDTLHPTSKGGTCMEFYNLLANAGTYSKFLEIYINNFVSEGYRDGFRQALYPHYLLENIKDQKFVSVNYAMKTTHGNQRSMMITVFSADGDVNSGKCIITATSIDNEYNMLIELDKTKEPEDVKTNVQNMILHRLGDIFYAVTLIDLSHNTYQEIISGKGLHPTIKEESNPQKAIDLCLDVFVAEQDQSHIRDFLDLTTLSERLKKQKSISAAFLGKNQKLIQLSFLSVLQNEDNSSAEVLLMVQIIEDIKDDTLKYQAVLKDSLDDALKLAETDGMTQLLNRKGGEKYINQYLSNGGNGMFCLLDVDDFKHYNDAYGHDIGDRVLQGVGDCIKQTFRSFDVLVRAGGDEFIIFAVGLLGRETGEEKIQELKKNVAAISIKGVKERVSISVGSVYSSDFSAHNFDSLFKWADTLMYREKASKKSKSYARQSDCSCC